MPFFSIIIPTFNARATLRMCIDSVLGQSLTDYEVIVVDDGSTDDTDKWVKHTYDGRITYAYQKNLGVCAARNHGVELSRGKYLIFLDSDDWLSANYLECYHKHLQQESIKLVMGRTTFFTKNQQFIREVLPVNEGVKYIHALAGSFALRRDVFDALGGYDENLSYSENTDLFLRMQLEEQVGVKEIRLEFKEGVCIRSAESFKARNIRYSKKKYESARYFLRKHKVFFDSDPVLFVVYKRIEALGAFQNNEFAEARRICLEIIRKNRRSLKNYFVFLMFCFPAVTKIYYNFRMTFLENLKTTKIY